MKNVNVFSEWQFKWGTPNGLFIESEGRKLEIAFLVALIFHLAPLGYLWHKQVTKKIHDTITLQNVELIEPEVEQPSPPPVAVQKPKSALDFLKMALPIFRKPSPITTTPREVLITPKIQEPKLAEPDRLIEKKMPVAPLTPEIKLDAKRIQAPNVIDLAKLPSMLKTAEPRVQEPSLKLEEVGKKAVAIPQTSEISFDKSASRGRAVDISATPKISQLPQTRQQASEKIVDKTAPAIAYKPQNLPLGYERRGGGGSVSLDQPREVVRTIPKPVTPPIITQTKKEASDKIEISKEKVKVTGPLSSRKVVNLVVPKYPAWARARNIEADVAIRFTVSPAGEVRNDAVVQRTSGFTELDKLALEALMKWKFSALSGNGQDQWGVVTFRFLLD